MGLIRIQPSRTNLAALEIIEFPPEASTTFRVGAPLQRDSGGGNPSQVEEHAGGATVTGILGFAQNACTSGTPDFTSVIQVARANAQTDFIGQVISVATVQTIAGDGTYLGNEYGLLKVSSEWYLDADDETNVHVMVMKELPEINCVLFRVISTAIGG